MSGYDRQSTPPQPPRRRPIPPPAAQANLTHVSQFVSSDLLPTFLEHSALPTCVVLNQGRLTLSSPDNESNAVIYNSGDMFIGSEPSRMVPASPRMRPAIPSPAPGCRLCAKRGFVNARGLCDECVYEMRMYNDRKTYADGRFYGDERMYRDAKGVYYVVGGRNGFADRHYAGARYAGPRQTWVRQNGGHGMRMGGWVPRPVPMRDSWRDGGSDTDDMDGFGGSF